MTAIRLRTSPFFTLGATPSSMFCPDVSSSSVSEYRDMKPGTLVFEVLVLNRWLDFDLALVASMSTVVCSDTDAAIWKATVRFQINWYRLNCCWLSEGFTTAGSR